jgi:kynurenine formamidase
MVRLIDLTPTMEEGMKANHPYHPRGPVILPNQRFELTAGWQRVTWADGGAPPALDGLPEHLVSPRTGRGMRSEEVLIHTHLGTHMDSALHYYPESAQDAAAIPLETCYGSAVLLDFRHKGEEPFEITIDDLDAAERAAGERVGPGDIVFFHTGWMSRWGVGPSADRHRYGSVPNPGLASDTPQWFIDRGVKVVGGDVANIDYDMTSSCHLNFLCREASGKQPIQIIENLAYLEKIPVARFHFIGFPLPIREGTASPIRAVAVVEG